MLSQKSEKWKFYVYLILLHQKELEVNAFLFPFILYFFLFPFSFPVFQYFHLFLYFYILYFDKLIKNMNKKRLILFLCLQLPLKYTFRGESTWAAISPSTFLTSLKAAVSAVHPGLSLLYIWASFFLHCVRESQQMTYESLKCQY